MRLIGDTVFLLGVGALVWFMLGLITGWSYAPAGTSERLRGLTPAPSRV